VDSRHPFLRDAIQTVRIRASRGVPSSLDPVADRNGHGTHGASVLMNAAPNAVIFVARVADDHGHLDADNDYESVAQVISS